MLQGKIFGLVISTFFAVVLLFNATPLKYLNLFEPRISDVDAEVFYDDFVKNPDEYIFIDVRPADEYFKFHAKGSINMPIHTLYDQRRNLPKSGRTIVLICSGGRLSGVAYHYLEHFGFLNLERIEGGVRVWESAELPMVLDSFDTYGSQ